MKRLQIVPMMLLIVIAGPACATTGSSAHSTNDEVTIRALEEQGRLAVLNKDFATLERIWSDRFMVNAPSNQISVNRSVVFAGLRQGMINYSSFERTVERILFDGDVAIVMGAEIVKPIGNAPMSGQTVHRRYTNIWKKEGGDWRLLARHANVIAPPGGSRN